MDETKPFFEAVVRPYRSLSAFGFRLVMAAIIVSNLVLAVVMISIGAWPVTGFLGLDVLAAYVAFRLSFAQTATFERITIAENDLIVAHIDWRGRAREWRFPSYWVSVGYDEEKDERGVLTVGSHGRRIEIGRFLHRAERAGLARQLRDALLRSRTSAAAT
jgi:uncharacterized membrane protein